VLNSVKEVLKRVDGKVDEIINDLKKRLDEILADGKKLDNSGRAKKKNSLKQESEPLEEIGDRTAKEAAEKAARRTTPSGQKGGNPGGKRTKIEKNADPEEVRSLTRENEAADKLANEGYKVEQNPLSQGKKNPDYRIEGEIFDCYSPKSSNARHIIDTVDGKVGTGQADRIVLNLTDSDVAVEALQRELSQSPVGNLKELMVLTKDGKIVHLFP